MAGTSVAQLINGVWRGTSVQPYTAIYDQSISILASGASGPNQLNGPISASTSISLPNSQTYNSSELEIYLNGQELEYIFDFTYVGSVPRTQVQFTFQLNVGDRLDFRIYRSY